MQSSAILENSKFGNVPFEHGRFGRSKPASHYMAGCCQPPIWANCSHSQAHPHPSHESAQSHHSPWWLSGMLCKKIHFFLPSPHHSWPLGGRGGVLLWAQHGGLALGARILAEAVRWSGFSCNCRGDFPVVFQPQLSCSCRHSQSAAGLLGQWWLLLPVPAGLLVVPERVSVVPVSAAMFPTEDVGRDPAVGMRLGGFLGVEQMHMCALAIASNLGSIL